MLVAGLSDEHNRVREAAALALAQRGEVVLNVAPDVVPVLIRALEAHAAAGPKDVEDVSVCGHVARLLAALSLRLTPHQRLEAGSHIERAVARYKDRNGLYVRFGSMATPAAPFLSKQVQELAGPMVWSPARLFEEIGFPSREDHRLPLLACDRRLAEAYASSPEQTMGAAIEAAGGDHLGRALGAMHWLMTLGPAARDALGVLEAVAGGPLKSRAREQASAAVACIRAALSLPDESAGTSAFWQKTTLPAAPLDDAVVQALQQRLVDESSVAVGVAGAFECRGRLFLWRRVRRSARTDAIRALFAAGWRPQDGRALEAMLAESAHAEAVCATAAVAQRFPLAW